MRKAATILGTIIVALVLASSTAFSWGIATHAYINDQLNKKQDYMNLQEIYGGMAPDLFNYLFASPHRIDHYNLAHYQFMNVWDEARTRRSKALAFGFVSHNNLWGADSTAHHAGRTVGKNEGYVIAKAAELANNLPFPVHLGIPADLAGELYHILVETGVDLLVKRSDPVVGQKMINAALVRSRGFPYLLAKTYADELSVYYGNSRKEAAAAIKTAESEFRRTVILYGYALLQDEETAIQLVAEQLAETAERYFKVADISPPPREQLEMLIVHYIRAAMNICGQQNRHAAEIKATQELIEEQLTMHGVTY